MQQNKKILKNFLGKGIGGKFFIKHILSKILIFFVNPITVFGNKLYLDYSDGIDHIFKDYKKFQMKVCMDNVKRGDMVLDVGGNIGFFAVVISKIIKNGKIFCFEASPKNCKLIIKNIRINKCSNIILENKAVSEKNGKLRLYLYRETKYHRLYPTKGHDRYVEVESVRLDDYFKDNDIKFDFAKIDVVGSEAKVIDGMLGIIKNSPNIKIMMEFSPERITKADTSPLNLLSILSQLGFNIFRLNLEKEELEPIKNYVTLTEDEETKYLFFKK